MIKCKYHVDHTKMPVAFGSSHLFFIEGDDSDELDHWFRDHMRGKWGRTEETRSGSSTWFWVNEDRDAMLVKLTWM
jgi:hypothetical protein